MRWTKELKKIVILRVLYLVSHHMNKKTYFASFGLQVYECPVNKTELLKLKLKSFKSEL